MTGRDGAVEPAGTPYAGQAADRSVAAARPTGTQGPPTGRLGGATRPAPGDPDPADRADAAGRQADPRLAVAADPPPLPDPGDSAGRVSRLAVAAGAVVLIGVLGGFGWLIVAAWHYVTTASDSAQQQHWEQLRGLIDVVTPIVLLAIGTVLGSTLQSRWTSAARDASARAGRAAGQQHVAAVANAEAARANAAAARTAAADLTIALGLLASARPVLSGLQELAGERDRAGHRFLTARDVTAATRAPDADGYRIERTGDVRLAEVTDEGVDRTITTLAVRAEVVAAEISAWLTAGT